MQCPPCTRQPLPDGTIASLLSRWAQPLVDPNVFDDQGPGLVRAAVSRQWSWTPGTAHQSEPAWRPARRGTGPDVTGPPRSTWHQRAASGCPCEVLSRDTPPGGHVTPPCRYRDQPSWTEQLEIGDLVRLTGVPPRRPGAPRRATRRVRSGSSTGCPVGASRSRAHAAPRDRCVGWPGCLVRTPRVRL